MTRKIKYLTKSKLVELNDKAVKDNRNQSIDKKLIDNLPTWNKLGNLRLYPVIFDMVHNDKEIRTMIQLGDKEGAKGLLDMSFRDFRLLPIVELPW